MNLNKRQRALVYLYGFMTEEKRVPMAIAQELTLVAKFLFDKAKEPGRLFLALGLHDGRKADAMVFLSTLEKVRGAMREDPHHYKTGKGIYDGIRTEPKRGKIYDLSVLDTLSALDRIDLEAFRVKIDILKPEEIATDKPLFIDEDGNELQDDQIPERYR